MILSPILVDHDKSAKNIFSKAKGTDSEESDSPIPATSTMGIS